MKTYDITLTISPQLPVWPGDPPIIVERISKMEEGAHCNITTLNMGAHVGTHVDAPYHFLGGDTPTVEKLALNLLTGRVYLVHLPDEVDLITGDVLRSVEIPPRTRRLLIKTRNSQYWANQEPKFQTGFVAISPDGAEYLVERGIRLVGIDYLSVAPFTQGTETHQVLLRAGIVVVEGLDLSQVSQGRYTLFCLPLKIAGSDGAPARTILIGV